MSREGKALFWYVAREDYALFDMSREKITRFFDVSREMDPRASSGKFLRVKSRYPESFMFLGLWLSPDQIYQVSFLQYLAISCNNWQNIPSVSQ